MENIKLELIKLLTKEMTEIFSQNINRELISSSKEDFSIVTEVDFLVSNFLKSALAKHSEYKNFTFFSEEDYSDFKFPCAIVDPIDGTRELAKGRAECAVSLALMHSPEIDDPRNYAWVYNPFSGFGLDNRTSFVLASTLSDFRYTGLASRSEFYKGLFAEIKNPKITVTPRGSIAFKLALLASGACDFVVSKNPKSVWDIAGGTILASQRGYHFYQNGKKVTKLDQQRYDGILIWAHESQIDLLWSEFQK